MGLFDPAHAEIAGLAAAKPSPLGFLSDASERLKAIGKL
jgi:hypothetical protein